MNIVNFQVGFDESRKLSYLFSFPLFQFILYLLFFFPLSTEKYWNYLSLLLFCSFCLSLACWFCLIRALLPLPSPPLCLSPYYPLLDLSKFSAAISRCKNCRLAKLYIGTRSFWIMNVLPNCYSYRDGKVIFIKPD